MEKCLHGHDEEEQPKRVVLITGYSMGVHGEEVQSGGHQQVAVEHGRAGTRHTRIRCSVR